MNILVTGAAGFIGSNLCDYLLKKGHTVVGIDNFCDYYDPKIKEYHIRDFKDNANFTLYSEDILDHVKLDEIFAKHKLDGVVHLAAWAGVTKSIEIPAVYARNNVEGTVNIAEMCVKHGVDNIVFASTSGIYGSNPTPFTEDMNTDFSLSPYPATKKACEVLLSTYPINHGLNVTIFRIFNPLGPRSRPDLFITKAIRSCLYGDELPVFWTKEEMNTTGRDYTYVEHILEAVETVLQSPHKYEIFNMGNSKPVLLGDMLELVQKVVGKPANVVFKDHRQGEMMVTYANIEKAKKILGYNPTTSVEESIKIYYDWFQQQDDNYKRGIY